MEPIQEVAPQEAAPVVPELLIPAPAEIEVAVNAPAVTITLPAAIESSVVEIEASVPHVFINGRDYGVDGLTLDYNKE